MNKIEYRLRLPEFHLYILKTYGFKLFKAYVEGYIKRHHPGLKVVKVSKPYWIICEEEDSAE